MTQWVAIVTYSANGGNQVEGRFDFRVRTQYCGAGVDSGQLFAGKLRSHYDGECSYLDGCAKHLMVVKSSR